MNDTFATQTATRFRSEANFVPPASGNWNFGNVEVRPVKELAWLKSAAAFAGLLITSNPASADLSVDFSPPRESETVEATFQPITHRRISLVEALRLSNQIMERAESGRQRAADEEAARTFDLEID